MTDMTVRDTLFEQFGALESKDQWWFMGKAMAVLQKTSKPKKGKKDKEDSASESGESKQKKEPNPWIKHVSYMRPIMNSLAKTDPVAKNAKAVTQVAKMLKEGGTFFTSKEDAEAAKEKIAETFALWKVDPPSSAASVASKEEKKDKKEKNTAIRTAKKLAEKAAASAASAATAADPASPPSTPAKATTVADGITTPPKIRRIIKKQPPKFGAQTVQGELETWEHNFGSGDVVYNRSHVEGTNTYYVYDPKDGYIGLYNEDNNELNSEVPDPLLN